MFFFIIIIFITAKHIQIIYKINVYKSMCI